MPPRNTPTAARAWSVILPPELHRAVCDYREERDITRSEAIRELVALGVGRPDLSEIERGRPRKNTGETTIS